MSFESLGLAPALLRALAEQGYAQPTPIQAAAIPPALEGRDLLAGAQTGTGKTAAFSLPLLERLYVTDRKQAQPKTPRALVLTPTRELAAQIHENVRAYGKHLGARATTIFGGVGMQPQVDALRRGVDILVPVHTDSNGLDRKLAAIVAGKATSDSLVDTQACRNYAAQFTRVLDERIAKEKAEAATKH